MKLTRFILGLALLALAIVVFELATEPYLATGELTQSQITSYRWINLPKRTLDVRFLSPKGVASNL